MSMTLFQALGKIRDAFDLALARGSVTPLLALPPAKIIPGTTECYGTTVMMVGGPLSGGSVLRVEYECYYAVHYDNDLVDETPVQDSIKLAWAFQESQRLSTDWVTAINQEVLLKVPDGTDNQPIEIFLNPVPRNGGVVTMAFNFSIQMLVPKP